MLTEILSSPESQADDAIRDILRTQYCREPIVRLDSPPGAGKTGIIVRLAVQSLAILKERCMVVTQTNRQCFDIAQRLTTAYSQLSFTLFCARTLSIPADLRQKGNLRIVHRTEDLPQDACVVIGNANKWAWVSPACPHFDSQFIDEAFQLHDAGFHLIANLADRIVLIGDPGQIDPVISCEIERWTDDPAGPHRPCPEALCSRHPGILRMSLPISRRLVADTVSFIRPAFYPDLPFEALSGAEDRRLEVEVGKTSDGLDRAIDAVVEGASLVQLELPQKVTGEVDAELADNIVTTIKRLLGRDAHIIEHGKCRRLDPALIGVACAHVTQVSAIRERLPQSCANILVETSNRFQGLERPIMLVHHPLSGRANAKEFHLDAGRLCVMLSRHKIGCFVFARAGIEGLLGEEAPQTDRILGLQEDPLFEGWKAHQTILQSLRTRERIFSI